MKLVPSFILNTVAVISICVSSIPVFGQNPDLFEYEEEDYELYDAVAETDDYESFGRLEYLHELSEHGEHAGLPADTNRNWWHLLKKGRLHMQDTTVEYPRFLKFCVDVYNWGDRAFNSYDTTYVKGTGKRWKLRFLNDNWIDSYAMNLDYRASMRMLSDINSNIGGYIQYMAVSLGYSLDVSKLLGHKDAANHKKFEFGFNCARFNLEAYYYENSGGTYLRRFGGYNNGHIFKSRFNDLSLKKYGIDAYYFLNNRKYSHGAAYNFSKFQLKSQGSFIIGFSYSNLNTALDLSSLDDKLKPYLNIAPNSYRFHYDSYCLLFGYGFNWVIAPRFLFNITALPSIGISHCYEDSVDEKGNLMSMNIKGKGSLTYNLGNVFFCVIARIDGNWYRSDRQSFFSSIENFSANIGFRF